MPVSSSTRPDDATRQLLCARRQSDDAWAEAWSIRRRNHPDTIRFDRPSGTLPISLTGQACALQCAHCAGVYLQHMYSPEKIEQLLPRATSFLVSGGCDAHGRVPVLAHLETLARVHNTHRLNWHVGLIDEATIVQIAPHADVVSFDVVGSPQTTRRVYGLDITLDDYMATFDALRKHVRVVPHVTIGLHAGHLLGERDAIAALAERGADHLVFIILIPTPDTEFANCSPPDLDEVAELLRWTRAQMPTCQLTLGCMRPHGTYRQAVDEIAVRAGLNGIVNPSRSAQDLAISMGLEPLWGNECCALN